MFHCRLRLRAHYVVFIFHTDALYAADCHDVAIRRRWLLPPHAAVCCRHFSRRWRSISDIFLRYTSRRFQIYAIVCLLLSRATWMPRVGVAFTPH